MLDKNVLLIVRRHWRAITVLVSVIVIPTPVLLVLLAGALYLGKRKEV